MPPPYEINPLVDPRWVELLRHHPKASVFHTPGWLEALRRTYGYRASVLTTSGPGSDLQDGLAFCYVRSWLTGRRLVSLPFSDHCELLTQNADDQAILIEALKQHSDQANCKYLEFRPASAMSGESGLERFAKYYLHLLDLRPGLDAVYQGFHRDCIQRKIRRAERETLTIRAGRTPDLLKEFYSLSVRTRRRQGLPPQPLIWFTNLADCLGTAFTVRIAMKSDQPIAGIVTVEHKQILTYKYGASDERFHNMGGMIYLFWTAIQDAVTGGLTELDMGRTDMDNPGLVAFKDHWGARKRALSYWRFPGTMQKDAHYWAPGFMKWAVSYTPSRFLISLGTHLYRHIG